MKIKNYTTEIFILTLVLVLLFYSSNPVFYPDSPRYLKGGLNTLSEAKKKSENWMDCQYLSGLVVRQAKNTLLMNWK